ncbi:putative ABC transporter permease [Blautia sp.]|uniref:ABC-transporter type IV n=1 Tax=Blautia glucerasea TaxID=536633 RepID=A0A6N2S915_9FIRM|nr:putative ABC transporter permease [uncultured Blautia sp.]
MWDFTINGIDLYHMINWFIIYSFFGWVWETFYVSIKQGEFINRGFISGPFCTIYGCGAIAVYTILKPAEGNLFILFFGGIVVATLLEYFTAVLMESIFHTSWWDYSDKKFNFQGRICLGASLGWGVFTVILFRVLHPVVEDLVSLYPVYVGKIGSCVFGAGYLVDFCRSASAAFHLRERLPQWEHELEKKQVELMLKLNARFENLEFARGASIESIRERMEDAEVLNALSEKRIAIQKELMGELAAFRKSLVARTKGNTRRFLKAYPHLNRGYRIHHKKNKK